MATNSLGTLTLDLVAKIGGFTGPLDKASLQTQRRMKSISSAIKNTSQVILALGAASAVAGGSLAAMAKSVSQNAVDIQNQARIANTSTKNFQNWSYATSTVGVQQDKLADILRDVNDKVGDFLSNGSGAMSDFFNNIAPKVGVTADSFKNLSGPQALQLYYNSLEKANVSQAQMTNYMESLASDSTDLIPLLQNNGKGLNEMSSQADRLGLALNDMEINRLVEVNREFSSLSETIRVQFTKAVASADLSPIITSLENLRDLIANPQIQKGLVSFTQGLSTMASGLVWAAAKIGLLMDKIDQFYQYIGAKSRRYSSDDIVNIDQKKIDSITETLTKQQAALQKWQEQADSTTGSQADYAKRNVERLKGLINQGNNSLKALYNQQQAIGIEKTLANTKRLLTPTSSPVDITKPSGIPYTPPAKSSRSGAGGQSKQSKWASAADTALADDFADQQEKINDLYRIRDSLISSNMTKSEKAFSSAEDQYKQLQKLRNSGEDLLLPGQDSQISDRIFQNAFTKAPSVGTDNTVSGREDKYKEQQKDLQDWYSTQMDLLEKFREERLGTVQEYESKEADIKQQYQAQSGKIQKQQLEDQLGNYSDIYDNMADVLGSFFGKQNTLYKAAFVTSKAFAISQALLNAPKTASDAYAAMASIPLVGPALGVAAAASAITAQLGFASQIQGVGLQGQAHDGLDSVPSTGTYNLQKNERVTSARTSAKMDRTLARVDANMDRSSRSGQRQASPIYIMNGSRARQQRMSNGELATVIDDDFEQGGPVSQTLLNRMTAGRRLK